MPINFILSIVTKGGGLYIGNHGKLVYHVPNDLKYFKEVTINKVVVMGHNTWKSLPFQPLPDRKNIVITNCKIKNSEGVDFMSLKKFKCYFSKNKDAEIYCIGGSQLFKTFMEDMQLQPNKLFITHMKPSKKLLDNMEADVFFYTDYFKHYKLYSYSKEYTHLKGDDEACYIKYRYLQYKISNHYHEEYNYLLTLDSLIRRPLERQDRTGVGVKSMFSNKLQFDISNSIPLLTTKQVSFKNIVEELLWFCRGETDANVLKKKGINIWNGNTTREFLDSRGLDYPEGELGPLYGFQMRHFGAKYPCTKRGFDQLKYVEKLLKEDPFNRRIMITYLNPPDYSKGVLLPCHHYIQFYVEEINGEKYLSCFFNMRSSDFALAGCYNIVSYTVLTYILAKKCDMKPLSIVYHSVDCHVYLNHIEAVKEQLKRDIRPFPALEVHNSIKDKKWEDISFFDFELVGYFPHPPIKMSMAV